MVHYLSISEAKVVFVDEKIEPVVRKAIELSTYAPGGSPPTVVALGRKTPTTTLSVRLQS
jgi:hypothetical protein